MRVETDDLVTVGTISRMLGIPRFSVPELVADGQLSPACVIDGIPFFDRRACMAFKRMRGEEDLGGPIRLAPVRVESLF